MLQWSPNDELSWDQLVSHLLKASYVKEFPRSDFSVERLASNVRRLLTHKLMLIIPLVVSAFASGATFTVTTLRDSGPGSLREALTSAMAGPDASDKIEFAVEGTIELSAELPTLSKGGTMVDGGNAITIKPATPSAGINGFYINSDENIIANVTIISFENGIIVRGNGNIFRGNYVGTNENGDTSLGNVSSGIYLDLGASDNVIGGESANERNIISGNGQEGISLRANGGQPPTGNLVQGNFIGLKADGVSPLGNRFGIILDGAHNNIIGGPDTAAGNNIAANQEHGIRIYNAHGNTISYNRIGVTLTTDNNAPNKRGIAVERGSRDNTVANNTIWGNIEEGILINGDSSGSTVRGNSISRNGFWGVVIQDASDNVIGVAATEVPNLIFSNGGGGIRIDGPNATQNAIRRNSIHDNAGPGLSVNEEDAIDFIELSSSSPISATTCPGCTVEFYADESDEGRTYIATATADSLGLVELQTPLTSSWGLNLTATTTDLNGTTHGFSQPIIINAIPRFISSPILVTNEDEPYLYAVSVQDTDVPMTSDRLTVAPIEYPSWMTVSTDGDLQLTGIPSQDDTGDHSIVIAAKDNFVTVLQEFTLNVQPMNDAPTINEGSSTSVIMDEDGAPTAFQLVLHAIDPDANTLTWSNTQASHGTSSVLSNGTTAAVAYNPESNFHGNDSFLIAVEDGSGGRDVLEVQIKVRSVNDAPVITSTPPLSGTVGSNYEYILSAEDVDAGDEIYFEAVHLPVWLQSENMDNERFRIYGIPSKADSGSHRLSLQVTDNSGAMATQAYIITVEQEHSGVISGEVVNASTIAPLVGASVVIETHSEPSRIIGAATSDVDGRFVVTVPSDQAPIRITCTLHGFDSVTRALTAPATLTFPLTPSKPKSPGPVMARVGADAIDIEWEPSDSFDVTGYYVYRSVSGSDEFILISGSSPIAVTSFSDSTVAAQHEYIYKVTAVDSERFESGGSFSSPLIAGVVTMAIPEVSAGPGMQVRVPLSISNSSGIDQITLNIRYPLELMEQHGAEDLGNNALVIEPTALTSHLGLSIARSGPETLVITAASEQPMNGDGALFNIVLDIKNDVESHTCGEVTFEDFVSLEQVMQQINSAVSLWSNGVPVLVDYGDSGRVCVSYDCIQGDLDFDGLITEDDARAALDHSVGKLDFNSCQRLSGDIDGNGRVDSGDAVLLLRLAAGFPIAPPSDVRPSDAALVTRVEVVEASAGEIVEVPITISEASQITAAEVFIAYAPELQVVGVTGSNETSSMSLSFFERHGVLQVAIAGEEPINSSGETILVKIKFRVSEFVTGPVILPVALNSISLRTNFAARWEWHAASSLSKGGIKLGAPVAIVTNLVGEGKIAPGNGTLYYPKGAEVMLTAIPSVGWEFLGWTGDFDTREASLQFPAMENVALLAVFRKQPECILEHATKSIPLVVSLNDYRQLRDKYMRTTSLGKVVESIYYRLSPSLIRSFDCNSSVKASVRAAMLKCDALASSFKCCMSGYRNFNAQTTRLEGYNVVVGAAVPLLRTSIQGVESLINLAKVLS